jgi:hypothetical protein
MPLHFFFFGLRCSGAGGLVEVEIREGAEDLAAVVAAFVRRLPGNWGEGALEEGVVYDVSLVIFTFDDPVAGIGFALS